MSKPGIKVTKLEKLGLRMDSCCEITFDDVELDEKDMFGREGNGFNRVKEEFDHERFLVALTNYGTAMCAFEDAALRQPARAVWRGYWSFPVDSGKIRPHGDQIKLHEKHAV